MTFKEIEKASAEKQVMFNGFNAFMLSGDSRVFGKMLARTLLFQRVKDLPGDIVECGIFKGTGLLTFLKLKRNFCPNSCKKIIGFDFFNTVDLVASLQGDDQRFMELMFDNREFKHGEGYMEGLTSLILDCKFEDHEFELIKGDVCQTTYEYIRERPGFRISLLYIDVDVEKPTYAILDALWDRVVPGGIVVFDDYGIHKWSEVAGVDSFLKDKGLDVESLNYFAPSACITKPKLQPVCSASSHMLA